MSYSGIFMPEFYYLCVRPICLLIRKTKTFYLKLRSTLNKNKNENKKINFN